MTIVTIHGCEYDLSKILQKPKDEIKQDDFIKLLLSLLLFRYFLAIQLLKNKNEFLHMYYLCLFLYLFTYLERVDSL